MKANNLLVVILHSCIARPPEIKDEWLAPGHGLLLEGAEAETDRGTDKLYDFRDIIENQQLIFPYSQIYINASRDPHNLDEAVPLNIREKAIYLPSKEPSLELRQELINKYYYPFYEQIRQTGKSLILNGHSTVAGHGSMGVEKLDWDIVLSDWLEYQGKVIRFAPPGYIDFYATEIQKRRPALRIGKTSVYSSTYDGVCVSFGWDGEEPQDNRVPVIHQETDEGLYITSNQIDEQNLRNLRSLFAESLWVTMQHFKLS